MRTTEISQESKTAFVVKTNTDLRCDIFSNVLVYVDASDSDSIDSNSWIEKTTDELMLRLFKATDGYSSKIIRLALYKLVKKTGYLMS